MLLFWKQLFWIVKFGSDQVFISAEVFCWAVWWPHAAGAEATGGAEPQQQECTETASHQGMRRWGEHLLLPFLMFSVQGTSSWECWETSERWGREHMGFSKHRDKILNWIELRSCWMYLLGNLLKMVLWSRTALFSLSWNLSRCSCRRKVVHDQEFLDVKQ